MDNVMRCVGDNLSRNKQQGFPSRGFPSSGFPLRATVAPALSGIEQRGKEGIDIVDAHLALCVGGLAREMVEREDAIMLAKASELAASSAAGTAARVAGSRWRRRPAAAVAPALSGIEQHGQEGIDVVDAHLVNYVGGLGREMVEREDAIELAKVFELAEEVGQLFGSDGSPATEQSTAAGPSGGGSGSGSGGGSHGTWTTLKANLCGPEGASGNGEAGEGERRLRARIG